MSVILDALKRVQDESNRREAELGQRLPAAHSAADSPPEDSASLLRRLRMPSPDEPADEARQVSPAIRFAVLVLCSAAVIAGALWWFEPSFSALHANADRPLLTGLSARGEAPVAAAIHRPPAAAVATADAAPGAAAVMPETAADGIVESPAAAAREDNGGADLDSAATDPRAEPAATDEPAVEASSFPDDLSDLSTRLPAAAVDSNDTRGVLRFEVAEPGAEADPGAIDLTSSTDPVSATIDARDGFPNAAIWVPGNPGAGEVPVDTPATTPRRLVDPGVRAAFEQGVRMQKAGDLYGAEDAYKRALKYDPNNAKVNANLGVVYERRGNFELAERHLRKSISVQADNASARNNLGVVLYRMGNYDGALIEFNRTLELDPTMLDAYTNKGLIFTRWGRYEDAERAFLQVLAFAPDNALAHYNLGLVYEEEQQLARAIEQYYAFLEVGGADYPDIAAFLSNHLPWLESRLDGTGAVPHR